MKRKMTKAQAETCLRFWLGKNEMYYSFGCTPTWDALKRNSYIEPTGLAGEFPNKTTYEIHSVTRNAAIEAHKTLLRLMTRGDE